MKRFTQIFSLQPDPAQRWVASWQQTSPSTFRRNGDGKKGEVHQARWERKSISAVAAITATPDTRDGRRLVLEDKRLESLRMDIQNASRRSRQAKKPTCRHRHLFLIIVSAWSCEAEGYEQKSVEECAAC